MPTPFPGMDPYLERPGLWSQVHTNLIVDIQRFLTPRLRPKYHIAIEQRTYLSLMEAEALVGEPDVLAILPSGVERDAVPMEPAAVTGTPRVVELPMPEEVVERYLEVRDVVTGEAITVIELLSPSNKTGARRRYERKRLQILGSDMNLVEIDLLCAGQPLPMRGDDLPASHYHVVISRAEDRPKAEVYLFTVRDPIPDVPVPLRPGEAEPVLALNDILHKLYDQSGYDLVIDYTKPSVPPLQEKDAEWASQMISSGPARKLIGSLQGTLII